MSESTPNQPLFDRSAMGAKPEDVLGKGRYQDRVQPPKVGGQTQAPSTVQPISNIRRG